LSPAGMEHTPGKALFQRMLVRHSLMSGRFGRSFFLRARSPDTEWRIADGHKSVTGYVQSWGR